MSKPTWSEHPLFTDTTPWSMDDIARELRVQRMTVRQWAFRGMRARAAGQSDLSDRMLPKPLPPAPICGTQTGPATWVVRTDRPRPGDRYVVLGRTYELCGRAELVPGAHERWLARVRWVGQDVEPGEVGAIRDVELVCIVRGPSEEASPRWAAGVIRMWAVRCARMDQNGRVIPRRPTQPPRWNGGAILGKGAGRRLPPPKG